MVVAHKKNPTIERIDKLIAEGICTLNIETLLFIHEYLFAGILDYAGELRKGNLRKKQWVLHGESVQYERADNIEGALSDLFEKQKQFKFSQSDKEESLSHLASFIARLWQVHPFKEGNTRVTTVFLINYINSFGFHVTNEESLKHHKYFRNTLVRAVYENKEKGIVNDLEPLKNFLRHAMFGESTKTSSFYLLIENNSDRKSGSKQFRKKLQ